MNKVILQVPVDKKIKNAAKSVAEDYGFSSLQETIRVILHKLAKRQLNITIEENSEFLNTHQDAVVRNRYQAYLNNKKSGKTFKAHSVKEMLQQLGS